MSCWFTNTFEVMMHIKFNIGKTILHKLPILPINVLVLNLYNILHNLLFVFQINKNSTTWLQSLCNILPVLQMFHVVGCPYLSQCNEAWYWRICLSQGQKEDIYEEFSALTCIGLHAFIQPPNLFHSLPLPNSERMVQHDCSLSQFRITDRFRGDLGLEDSREKR